MTQVFGLTHNATLSAPAYSVDLGNEAVRLGSLQGLGQSAAVGNSATSGITIDDPTGTLDIPAWYYFVVRETALPAGNDTIFHGQTVVRTVSRGPYIAGAGREWSVDLIDDNSYLGARLVLEGADRPEETASARLTWLLGTSYCPVSDLGMVDYDTGTTMSANDYDGQFYKDVLADIAIATGYNFWVEYIQSSGLLSLHMYDPDSTRYTSLARISNVYTDYASGSNTFAGQNAKATYDPTRVYSGTRVEYNGGAVRRTSGATSSNFAIRDGIAPMGNVSTLTAATALADKFLADNDTEDERVDVTIRVPRAQARDVRPGHRIHCKFSHLPGWEDWRYARVVEHHIAQIAPDETYYTMPLKLIPVATTAEASIATYGTDTYLGNYEGFTWVSEPAADQTLVGFLAQRSSSDYDADIVPWSNLNPAGDPAIENIAGTQWTYLTGLDISTTLAYPITMARRYATADDAGTIRWGGTGGLSGTSRPRSHQVAFTGLAGTSASVVTLADQTDGGATMTTPSVTATGAGYIVAGFSHAAAGPADGFSVESVFAADSPAQLLTQGQAYADFGPWSGLAVLRVESAGSYTVTIQRTSATPRNSTYAWGCIAAFFADA